MKKKKVYSSDLKLQIIKEYLNSEKSLKDFSDEYSIPINTLSQWVQKYKKSNYDDSVFNTKKGRTKSMISDYSKIPPIIYKSAGISRPDDSNNSNDSVYLKKKLNYYEKILLEKELHLRILQDELELLKKKYEPQVNHTDIGKLLLIIKYRNYGVCLSYLLDYFHMSSSSFYFKTRLFFVGESILQCIYVLFYHNLRPHSPWNYMTSSEFSRIFSNDNNCFNSKTIFVKK